MLGSFWVVAALGVAMTVAVLVAVPEWVAAGIIAPIAGLGGGDTAVPMAS